MEEKKKKKLTLSVSSKTPHNVPNYVKSRQKTSVVIEKKAPRKWGEKKFSNREIIILINLNQLVILLPKKKPINKNLILEKWLKKEPRKDLKI